MGKKIFDFRQFTLLQGLPRSKPILQLTSAGLADANTKVLRGDVDKDFEQDLFTALEYVPYLGTATKYAQNIPQGMSQLAKDVKHLPNQLKRKLNASERIIKLRKQKEDLLDKGISNRNDWYYII